MLSTHCVVGHLQLWSVVIAYVSCSRGPHSTQKKLRWIKLIEVGTFSTERVWRIKFRGCQKATNFNSSKAITGSEFQLSGDTHELEPPIRANDRQVL